MGLYMYANQIKPPELINLMSNSKSRNSNESIYKLYIDQSFPMRLYYNMFLLVQFSTSNHQYIFLEELDQGGTSNISYLLSIIDILYIENLN